MFVNGGSYWGAVWGQVLIGRVSNPLILPVSCQFTIQSVVGSTGSVSQGDRVKIALTATNKNMWAFGLSAYGNMFSTLLVGDTMTPDRSQGATSVFTLAEPQDKSQQVYKDLMAAQATTTAAPQTTTTTTIPVTTTTAAPLVTATTAQATTTVVPQTTTTTTVKKTTTAKKTTTTAKKITTAKKTTTTTTAQIGWSSLW